MTVVYESVQPSAIPPTLELRLLAGRAAEMLELLPFLDEPPADFSFVLNEAAKALRFFAQVSSPSEAKSAQQATDQIEQLLSAIRTLKIRIGEEMAPTLVRLITAANDLERLASGERLGSKREGDLGNLLQLVREVAASMRARVPESSSK